MGIKTTISHQYTCDKCHKDIETKDVFTQYNLPCGGDGRDVFFNAYVDIQYVVDYVTANGVVCKPCAVVILKDVVEKLEEE